MGRGRRVPKYLLTERIERNLEGTVWRVLECVGVMESEIGTPGRVSLGSTGSRMQRGQQPSKRNALCGSPGERGDPLAVLSELMYEQETRKWSFGMLYSRSLRLAYLLE